MKLENRDMSHYMTTATQLERTLRMGSQTHHRWTLQLAAALALAALTGSSFGATVVPVTDDLLLHLDAGVGVTTSAGQVTGWADQATTVGGANDAVAPGNGPTLVASGINGLPTLNFSAASSQYLQIAGNSAFDSDEFTWFIVGQTNTPGSTTHLIRSSYTSGAGGASGALWGTFTQSNVFKSNARTQSGVFKSSDVAATTNASVINAQWSAADTVSATVTTASGSLTGATATGADAAPTGHNYTRIGANTTLLNEFYDGKISEVLVYNSTLAPSQRNLVQGYLNVKYDTVTPTLRNGLAMYSSMDNAYVDRAGTNPPPALSTDDGDWTVQNQINPAANGAATSDNNTGRVTSSAVGQVGQAIDFSADKGGNRHVSYGDTLDITAGVSQTISLWFNSREFNQTVFIAGKGNAGSGNNGWAIGLLAEGGGKLMTRAQYTGASTATQNLGAARSFLGDDTNEWHHVVMVIDNANGLFTAYFDGLSSGASGTDNGWGQTNGGIDTNTFAPGQNFSNADDIRLGIRIDNAAEWNGLIDEFAIWNRALSAQEIADLYSLGAAGIALIPTPAALPAGLTLLTLVGLRRRRH